MTIRTTVLPVALLAAIAGSRPISAQIAAKEPVRLTRVANVDGVLSPDGTLIAFASNRQSADPREYDIWIANGDGTHPRPLTTGAGTDETPMFSPDGKKVAYASEVSGNSDIYVRNVDGSGAIRLTDDLGSDIHPMWTADGSRILFNSSRRARNAKEPEIFDVFAVRPDGSGLRQLTHHDGVTTYASLSPDGRRLLFRRVIGDNSEVFVSAPDGSQPKNLTNDPGFDGWPVFSPSGKKIAFVSSRANSNGSEIFMMDSDGLHLVQLTHSGLRSFAPSFSPDERKIIFTQSGNGVTDLFVLNLTSQ